MPDESNATASDDAKPSAPKASRASSPAAKPVRKPARPPGAKAVKKPAGPGGKLPPGFRPKQKKKPTKSAVEVRKEQSNYLYAGIPEQLASDADHFPIAQKEVLKHCGIYQQDDRDVRKQPGGKRYYFFVRSKLPGGKLTADQYLVHDRLADAHGIGQLRITTRQGIQIHGIAKGDLKPHLQALNEAPVTTLEACGDVVRNVPVVFRALAETQMPVEVLIMEEHMDLMDEFLTYGGRAIPVVIFADTGGHVVGRWGPRPQYVQEPMAEFKRTNPDREAPDYGEKIAKVREEIGRRYGEDNTYQGWIVDELKQLLSGV